MHPNGGIKWDGQLMPFPWWGGSVAEGIFLISAERNADRILGAAFVSSPLQSRRFRIPWLTLGRIGPGPPQHEPVAVEHHDNPARS